MRVTLHCCVESLRQLDPPISRAQGRIHDFSTRGDTPPQVLLDHGRHVSRRHGSEQTDQPLQLDLELSCAGNALV